MSCRADANIRRGIEVYCCIKDIVVVCGVEDPGGTDPFEFYFN